MSFKSNNPLARLVCPSQDNSGLEADPAGSLWTRPQPITVLTYRDGHAFTPGAVIDFDAAVKVESLNLLPPPIGVDKNII